MSATAKKLDKTLEKNSAQAVDKLQDTLDTAREKVVSATAAAEETYDDLRHRAERGSDKARRQLRMVRERVEEGYGRAQEQIRDAGHTSEKYVREHPMQTTLFAVLLGFGLGWLLKPSR